MLQSSGPCSASAPFSASARVAWEVANISLAADGWLPSTRRRPRFTAWITSARDEGFGIAFPFLEHAGTVLATVWSCLLRMPGSFRFRAVINLKEKRSSLIIKPHIFCFTVLAFSFSTYQSFRERILPRLSAISQAEVWSMKH